MLCYITVGVIICVGLHRVGGNESDSNRVSLRLSASSGGAYSMYQGGRSVTWVSTTLIGTVLSSAKPSGAFAHA